MPLLLSDSEQEIWHALKQLSETALTTIERDIVASTGLSGADFGILSRLEDRGDGTLLQHELAGLLGWHKARLSHQLTRMERRMLLRRDHPPTGVGTLVSIVRVGRETIAAARPIHAKAIREHVLTYLDADEARTLVEVVRRMRTGSRLV